MPRQTSVDPRKTGSQHIPVASTPYVYRLVIEPDEGRYYAEIPALAGCYSWGRSYEEALKNIKEALELWLEVKKEAGEPILTDDLETEGVGFGWTRMNNPLPRLDTDEHG